jgi:DNA-binding Xre family transcriptional regulator
MTLTVLPSADKKEVLDVKKQMSKSKQKQYLQLSKNDYSYLEMGKVIHLFSEILIFNGSNCL